MSKYIHEEIVHNLKSPEIIVPEVIKLINPKSVVDIGCGTGTFLHVFKKYGIRDILGIDGAWVEKQLLYKNLTSEEFQEADLEKEIKLNKKYDLVVSLEVAEHLSTDSAEVFVQSLINAGNIILFSAAIPNQGGQNHINEQWLTYWEKLFLKHNYIIYDVIRPIFWDNPNVFWWYKQNIVLIASKDFKLSFNLPYCPMRNIIHYELYNAKNDILEKIIRGKMKKKLYLKWLLKSFFNR